MSAAIPPDIPFARWPLVRTGDLDEANAILSRTYRPTTIKIERRSHDVIWHANAVSLGPILMVAGWVPQATRLTSDPSGDAILLLFSRGGAATLQVGGEELDVNETKGVFLDPTRDGSLSLPADFRSLTIGFDKRAMESALQALIGDRPGRPLLLGANFNATSGPGAEIARLLHFIVDELNNAPSILTSPLVLTSLCEALTRSILIGQDHNFSPRLAKREPPPAARSVRAAMEYIDANAAEPITMADLAGVSGVSVRSLQAGFRSHRGCSPMAFLKERRLAVARAKLTSARPGTTVTEVAYDCGFSHLGRFSQEYRRRFGESPSITLSAATRPAGSSRRRGR